MKVHCNTANAFKQLKQYMQKSSMNIQYKVDLIFFTLSYPTFHFAQSYFPPSYPEKNTFYEQKAFVFKIIFFLYNLFFHLSIRPSLW